ncbi:MAG: membrane protein insertion efficiency factor YidD [Alphaproteobacteria bacterium]|nr:membrane protein insertion efficiency factor YidD [Alphaproteobacteria bacterium]
MPARLSIPAHGLIGLVRLYRVTLSPAFALIGRCRHAPSCAAFMCDAVSQHGAWAGGWMGVARICRCRPGGSSGWDPAPAEKPASARWWTPWRYGDWRGGVRQPPSSPAVEG